MDNTKYIGMDVHTETISIAVLNSIEKLVMESVIETKGLTVIQFVQGLRADLHFTLEEGTWAGRVARALNDFELRGAPSLTLFKGGVLDFGVHLRFTGSLHCL
jgi:hypothetical protein